MAVTTRREIVERAETGWPLDAVPYSQSGVWNDDDGRTDEDGYRRDCSGFASMAMGLARPGASTVTLVTAGHAKRIEWAQLRPGDLVMLGGLGTGGDAGHVGVAVSVDHPGGLYVMLEQSGGLGPDRNAYRIGTASRPGMVPYASAYVTEEDDMTPTEHQWTEDNAWRLTMLQDGSTTFPNVDMVPAHLRGADFWATAELKRQGAILAEVEAKLDELAAPVIDPAALRAALVQALADPAVQAVLVSAAEQGAQRAEDR